MAASGDSWIDAIRGLKDNPIHVYLRLAQRRRVLQIGWLKRYAMYIIIVLIELAVTAYGIYTSKQATGLSILSGITWAVVAQWCFYLALPLYILWAIQGLFCAAQDALLVLAPAGRRLRLLVLDDICAITRLSNREIAAGFIANLLPPLLWRIGTGSALLTGMSISTTIMVSGQMLDPTIVGPALPQTHSIWPYVIPGLAAFLITSLLSVVGTIALLLLLVTMSRGLRPVLATSATVLMVIMQLQYSATAFSMSMGRGFMFVPSDQNDAVFLLIAVGIAALIFGILAGAVVLSRFSHGFRQVFAVGGSVIAAVVPLAFMGAMYAFILAIQSTTAPSFNMMPYYINGMMCYMDDIGALSVLNPAAQWLLFSATLDAELQAVSPLRTGISLLLIILLQLTLIWLFAREVLLAIGMRRSNNE